MNENLLPRFAKTAHDCQSVGQLEQFYGTNTPPKILALKPVLNARLASALGEIFQNIISRKEHITYVGSRITLVFKNLFSQRRMAATR